MNSALHMNHFKFTVDDIWQLPSYLYAKAFSLFLNLPRVGGSSLQKNFLENKNAILRELYSLKGEIFKDINKKLLSDLILFFEQVPHGGTYYLKHYTFSSVWEKMVESSVFGLYGVRSACASLTPTSP